MKQNLWNYIPFIFTGYSFFQLLGQVIRGFPDSRNGAISIVLIALFACILLGFYNWCGLYKKSGGYLRNNQTLVGFAPAIAFGTPILIAVSIGMALGG